MTINERQKELIDILTERQRASVKLLSKKLFVSEMTVRRDLNYLERSGYLTRYHGGAVLSDESSDFPMPARMHINESKKRDLAKIAGKYLRDNMRIYLDSSSTCAYLIPYLKKFNSITVVTNSVMFILPLTRVNAVCKLTGGDYSYSEQCLLGRDTEDYLRRINVDVAFLSCDGISNDGILTYINGENAAIARIMRKNSSKCVFLVDKSKQGILNNYNAYSSDEISELLII